MMYHTLFVGIDISKLKHDVAVLNEHKQVISKPFVIADTRAGYQQLIEKLDCLRDMYQTSNFLIGFEATSEYWKNIYYFLKRQSKPFVVVVINPLQTKAHATSELRRAKTDPVDAKDIALFMLEKRPVASFDRPPVFDTIKDMDRQICHLKKQHTMLSNRLRLELTKVAPEIDKAFRKITGKQLLAVLTDFPTAEIIANTPLEELSQIQYGPFGRNVSQPFIMNIKALAEHSIACKNGIGAGFVVQSLALSLLHIQQQTETLKRQAMQLYQGFNEQDSVLASIPGISRETAILLEAYIGDVNRFSNAKKMVAYFGMNPVVNLSGKGKKASYLQKKGNPVVRHKLYMAILSMIRQQQQPFYSYYKRLVDAGKPKLVAIGAAMRKLLVTMFYMLKNKKPFDENY